MKSAIGPKPCVDARQAEIIEENIRRIVKSLRSDGTVGMSLANLYQITPTSGVMLSDREYRSEFERIARKVAPGFAK